MFQPFGVLCLLWLLVCPSAAVFNATRTERIKNHLQQLLRTKPVQQDISKDPLAAGYPGRLTATLLLALALAGENVTAEAAAAAAAIEPSITALALLKLLGAPKEAREGHPRQPLPTPPSPPPPASSPHSAKADKLESGLGDWAAMRRADESKNRSGGYTIRVETEELEAVTTPANDSTSSTFEELLLSWTKILDQDIDRSTSPSPEAMLAVGGGGLFGDQKEAWPPVDGTEPGPEEGRSSTAATAGARPTEEEGRTPPMSGAWPPVDGTESPPEEGEASTGRALTTEAEETKPPKSFARSKGDSPLGVTSVERKADSLTACTVKRPSDQPPPSYLSIQRLMKVVAS